VSEYLNDTNETREEKIGNESVSKSNEDEDERRD